LNVIAVRVDATPVEGWWYEGAGIYRHVWLINAPPMHVANDGIFVRPVKRSSDGAWDTHVEIELENSSDLPLRGTIQLQLIDPSEHAAADAELEFVVPARGTGRVGHVIELSHPELWELDDPNLYILHVAVRPDGGALDVDGLRFGYRT